MYRFAFSQLIQNLNQERGLISLKKYLDMKDGPATPEAQDAETGELLAATLDSYRSALQSMGRSGARACPGVGAGLQQALAKLESGLAGEVTPALMTKTSSEAEAILQNWGGCSEDYFKAKTKEVKELLIVLAHTAQSVGDRDQKYTSQFSEFTTRLRTIANLEDLTQIRSSLFQRATELKNYVDRMAEDSKQSVAQLKAEVSTYEIRLRAVEELALRDSLTGLANRRNIEERIQERITGQKTFCVLSIDLNGLKQVNDTYGHLAGDNLLKQFSHELRSNLGPHGMPGRWGGDEFIVILDCGETEAGALVERVRKWVFGDYTLQSGNEKAEVKVRVDASVGLSHWARGKTMQQIIEQADAAMYQEKKAGRKKGAAAGR